MTIHTMRGSTQVIKSLYSFHVNVVTSVDMAIFIAIANGAQATANTLIQKKQENVQHAITVYWLTLITKQPTTLIQWTFLYPSWTHYLEFHQKITNHTGIPGPTTTEENIECIWETK